MLATLLGGCAPWSNRTTDQKGSALPALKESNRSIVLHVEFVPIEVDTVNPDVGQSLWQWVDETSIDKTTRRNWLENGLRSGRVINQERFRAKLDSITTEKNAVDQFLTEASVASELSQGGKRIPMRLGRRYELPLRQPVNGEQTTLVRIGDQTIGKTLLDPQFLLAIVPTAGESTKQLKLRLRPEIQHGIMRQQWIESDKALRINRRRDAWSLKELDLELTASESDMFVISNTLPRVGLGRQMLGGTRADFMEQQVIVLVRVQQIPTPDERL